MGKQLAASWGHGERLAAEVAQAEHDRKLAQMGLTKIFTTELRRSREAWTLYLIDKRAPKHAARTFGPC